MEKSERRETIYAILSFIVLILIVYLTIGSAEGEEDTKNRRECPYEVHGNPNATFTIKYIDSPYCIWCWFEEPILQGLLDEKGDSFKLEKYDIRYCNEVVQKHRFSGTPSFVFSQDGKEYAHTGYLEEEALVSVICSATGDCYAEDLP